MWRPAKEVNRPGGPRVCSGGRGKPHPRAWGSHLNLALVLPASPSGLLLLLSLLLVTVAPSPTEASFVLGRRAAGRALASLEAGTAAAKCPSGATFFNKGVPLCMCPSKKPNWYNNACTKTKLKNGPYLNLQNAARVAVGAPTLTWNKNVAKAATAWANVLKKGGCNLAHPTGTYAYGQNLYAGDDSNPATAAAVEWLSEASDYKNDVVPKGCKGGTDIPAFLQCGHYTQVVWKNSTQIGCATVTCDGFVFVVVCNYYPKGNIMGFRPY